MSNCLQYIAIYNKIQNDQIRQDRMSL